MRNSRGEGEATGAAVVLFVLMCIGVVLVALMWGMPQYYIWNAEQEGKAELAKAEYSKRVAVETSKAKKDSAQFEADAEVTRAQGVAKANNIIGASLQNNEAYLRYLWIHTMQDTQNQVIYVPTEAALPVLEAGARQSKQVKINE